MCELFGKILKLFCICKIYLYKIRPGGSLTLLTTIFLKENKLEIWELQVLSSLFLLLVKENLEMFFFLMYTIYSINYLQVY